MAHVIGRNDMPKKTRPIKTSVTLKEGQTDSFSTYASKKKAPIKGSPQ